MIKICNKCKLPKDSSEFYKDKRTKKDGLYGHCKECHFVMSRTWQKKHPEYMRAKATKWAKENPEKIRLAGDIRRQDAAYRLKENQWNKNYKSRNKSKINSINAGRRATQLQATPIWLTPKMKAEIDFFYWLSETVGKTFGVAHHVDHIDPLKSDLICGLHVPWNLQVLTAPENLAKHNKLTS